MYGNRPYVGLDEILGNAAMGADAEQALAELLSGDDALDQLASLGLGIDDILGAVAARAPAKSAGKVGLQNLALLKAAGQRAAVQTTADNLKYESLPIPLQNIPASGTVNVPVQPIRSMRLDRVRFPSSNVDHQFVQLTSLQILGIEQLNGAGGILLSELSELCTDPGIRGNTMQAGQNVILIFQNLDTVNARTCRGTMSGPSIRV